ncbi:MAG TPA: hypothetical protein VLD37_04690 [Candidatus Bilamarchaeum sp.]|nr:hypothetical protein [Candidatus Bilamarchaeum sp.]
MDKRKALIATNIALAVAGTSFVGFTGYMAHRENEAREGRVAQLVQRFHGCPERFIASQECFSEDQRRQIFQAAERAEADRRWADAATDYARLIRSPGDEMETKAREMAGNCSEDTRRDIGDAIRVRLEAVSRVSQEPPPIRTAPSGSAPAVDAGVPQPVQDAGAPDAAPEAPDAAVDAAPQERTVTITFRTEPSGVDVRLGDESKCVASPQCSVSFPAGTWGLEFNFSADGYRSRTQSVVPDQDRTVEVHLERARQRGRGGAPARTSTPRHDQPPPAQPQPTGNPGVISSPD